MNTVSIVALKKQQLVELLSGVGSSAMSLERLEQHISNGAPVNVDGTVNLLHYTAWLAGKVRT